MITWPNFFIVGAPKAGTTSLFHYLEQSDDIFFSPTKEPHFFCPDYADMLRMEHPTSATKYTQLFSRARSDQICGEASTAYLRAPEAPENIYAQIPKAKIIILLRNPADRAYSHYLMHWSSGSIEYNFSTALADYRAGKNLATLFYHTIIEPGFYWPQIQRYLGRFGPNQVKLIVSDDFFANPQDVLNDIGKFLGIRDIPRLREIEHHNKYAAPRGSVSLYLLRKKYLLRFLKPLISEQLKWHLLNKLFKRRANRPQLSEGDRRLLDEIYADSLAELRRFLNRPYLWLPSGEKNGDG